MLSWSSSGEDSLVVNYRFIVTSDGRKKARKFSKVFIIRASIPFMKAATSWTNYLPKVPPLNTTPWG